MGSKSVMEELAEGSKEQYDNECVQMKIRENYQ